MKKTRKKGFTLIELIVVIAIIGVLAAILVPTMMGYVKKSKRAADVTSARNMHTDILDLILEDDEAYDSFYGQGSSYKNDTKQKTDEITGKDYDLVLVAYLDGAAGTDGKGNTWHNIDTEQIPFCNKLNSRLDYDASSKNIKVKIKSKSEDSSGEYNRWYVGYRKDSPSTIEIWVGDGNKAHSGEPLKCLYTQISRSND